MIQISTEPGAVLGDTLFTAMGSAAFEWRHTVVQLPAGTYQLGFYGQLCDACAAIDNVVSSNDVCNTGTH